MFPPLSLNRIGPGTPIVGTSQRPRIETPRQGITTTLSAPKSVFGGLPKFIQQPACVGLVEPNTISSPPPPSSHQRLPPHVAPHGPEPVPRNAQMSVPASLVSAADYRKINRKYEFGPLTTKQVPATMDLVSRTFGPSAHGGVTIEYDMLRQPYRHVGVPGLVLGSDHWVVTEPAQENRVVATIGLYVCSEDQEEALWVDWFAVDASARKQGLGTTLLEFVINKATQTGKPYLRLETDESPALAAACRMYTRYGFKTDRADQVEGEEYRRLYKTLELRDWNRVTRKPT